MSPSNFVLRSPSSTSTRFALLVFSLLFAAVPLFRNYTVLLQGPISMRDCLRRVPMSSSTGDYVKAVAACPLQTVRSQMGPVVVALVVLLIVIFLLYLLHPSWYCRRHRLIPVGAQRVQTVMGDAYAQLLADLAALHEECGVSRPLGVFVGAAGTSVFGRFPRYRIALDWELLLTYKHHPDRFRGIVRHELAHCRNRDVDRTQLTRMSWFAFLILVAGPLLAVALLDFVRGFAWQWQGPLWQLASAVGLVWLAVCSIHRAREHYADVRAAQTDDAGGLVAELQAAHERERERRGAVAAIRPAWGRWYHRIRQTRVLHPSFARRLDVLRAPDALLRLGLVEPFAAGAAVGLGLPGLQTMFQAWGTRTMWTTPQAGFLMAVPIALVLSACVLRAAGAGVEARRKIRIRGACAGVAAAAGMLVGEGLNWKEFHAQWWTHLMADPADALITAGVLAGGLVLLVEWLIVSVPVLQPGPQAHPPRAWAHLTTAAALTLPLVYLFSLWQVGHAGPSCSDGSVPFAYDLLLTTTPGLDVAALAGLGALPLLGACLTARPDERTDISSTPQRLVFTVAGASAVASLAFIGPLDHWWDRTVTVPRPSDATAVLLQQFTALAVLQVLAGMLVAWVAGRQSVSLGIVHGLSAALLSGVCIVLAITTAVVLRDAVLGTGIPWHVLRNMSAVRLGQGSLTSLAFVLGGALTGRGLFLLRQRVRARRRATPSGDRLTVRVLRASAVLVMAVGIASLGTTARLWTLGGPSAPAQGNPSSKGADPDAGLRLPADRGTRALCAWLPKGYGFSAINTVIEENKRGITTSDVTQFTWLGTVLSHADDPQLARVGEGVATTTRKGDLREAVDAFTAMNTLCTQSAIEKETPGQGSPVPARDPCLVGEWHLTKAVLRQPLPGKDPSTVLLTSTTSYTRTYRSDGSGVEMAPSFKAEGSAGATPVTLTRASRAIYHWEAALGVHLQTKTAATGTTTLTIDHRQASGGKLPTRPRGLSHSYRCDRSTLHFEYGHGESEEFARSSPAGSTSWAVPERTSWTLVGDVAPP
ncbi:M48 family metalloprotease [Streptomyces sp. UNOB3_S3]|uniref:M48 family metalloprotease n=1 Tax=Streptomyces sp. UNOB3_S3 TaxID=2871682 RepID=UPI001E5EC518|nr:M48 family metalloprotease [Streptomyces sp. UNOB3_S3]MCC3773740.1 M48 family metalloprotease [Streptomyces sp. UNOB3_S3]